MQKILRWDSNNTHNILLVLFDPLTTTYQQSLFFSLWFIVIKKGWGRKNDEKNVIILKYFYSKIEQSCLYFKLFSTLFPPNTEKAQNDILISKKKHNNISQMSFIKTTLQTFPRILALLSKIASGNHSFFYQKRPKLNQIRYLVSWT